MDFKGLAMVLRNDETNTKALAFRARHHYPNKYTRITKKGPLGDWDRGTIADSFEVILQTDGQHIFSMDMLRKMKEIEDFVSSLKGYTSVCLLQLSGQCHQPLSVIRNMETAIAERGFPNTMNSTVINRMIREVICDAYRDKKTSSKLKIFLENGYDPCNANSTAQMTRMFFQFGFGKNESRIYKTSKCTRSIFQNNVLKPAMDTIRQNFSRDGINLHYFSHDIFLTEAGDQAMKDAWLGVGGFLFIFTIMWFQTQSFWITFMGLYSIITSFLIANLVYRFCFGFTYFGYFHVVAIFIIIGIGADDVFVELFKESNFFGKAYNLHRQGFQRLLDTDYTDVYLLWGMYPQDTSSCKFKSSDFCHGSALWDKNFNPSSAEAQISLKNMCNQLRSMSPEESKLLMIRQSEDGTNLDIDCFTVPMLEFLKNEIMPMTMINGFQLTDYTWHWMRIQETLLTYGLEGLAISLGIALPVLVVSSMNIYIGLIATLVIGLVITSAIGLLPLTGHGLGVIESINLYMVVGLSVDYVVHFAEAYRFSSHPDRKRRVGSMLENMGLSVTSGALTTFGAASFMLWADIRLISQFGLFVMTIISLSYIYSLFGFSAVMALFGPEGDTGNLCVIGRNFGRLIFMSCSTCLHMNISLFNMPQNTIDQLKTMFSSMENPGCDAGTAQITPCQSTLSQRTKCMKTTIRGRFVGMKNLYPEAVMEQIVVVRACAPRPLTEPDKCMTLDELDPETKTKVTAQLEQAKAQWESLSLTGDTCFKGAGDVPYKPETKDPDNGSGRLFNMSHFLITLLAMTAGKLMKTM
ncbi:hypothetical protein FSP39_022604 [Pinctada imbricata]|uniref:SSD domain-containing protein n=1 Tax=Pinctada imbricata TaxID=66713 RepID=A0AA88YCS9_PINIB|nr:hypothetical protein FSP39_022604 [Pinctada imbricata]